MKVLVFLKGKDTPEIVEGNDVTIHYCNTGNRFSGYLSVSNNGETEEEDKMLHFFIEDVVNVLTNLTI